MATCLVVLSLLVAMIAVPNAVGAQTTPPSGEIEMKVTCLQDRGRIDVIIPLSALPLDSPVTAKIGTLTRPARSLDNGELAMTVTGRPDGEIPVEVFAGGKSIASRTLTVACSPDLARPELMSSCLAGRGRVDVTTPKGKNYTVSFPGLSDRKVTGVTGRTGRVTWTGRPDGDYPVKAVADDGTTTTMSATVSCAPGPAAGELQVKTSCLAKRGRLDITYRATKTGTHEVVVGSLAARTHSVQSGGAVRDTVTGRPDGPIDVLIKQGGATVARKTVTVDCAAKSTASSLNLEAYDDCPAFLADIKSRAIEEVTAYGLGTYGGVLVPNLPSDEVGGSDYSETNNQVAGVDEPDLMKTNGEVLVVASGSTVYVYTVSGGTATEQDRVDLVSPVSSLFFEGSNVIAITDDSGWILDDGWVSGVPPMGYGSPTFMLTQLRLTPPATPAGKYDLTKQAWMEMDGRFIDARLQNGLIRLVSNTTPNLLFESPPFPATDADLEATRLKNQQVIRDSGIADWLGTYSVTQKDGPLLGSTISDCRNMYLPDPFSGFASTALTTIDPATMTVTPGPGILSDSDTVYASADALYVSTNEWGPWLARDLDRPQVLGAPLDSTFTTQIHKFDTTQATPTYEGSGRVRGHLLNQFAMHEYDGRLFVASTDGATWWANTKEAQSYVSVFEATDGRLAQVGQVGNLGRGERIFGVRYVEDAAYVVTFRQTDPLYVVDLRNPTAPKVTGELKIPGYSAYLHPIGDGRLLGVGSDADAEGRVTGAKLALFDVSNPAKPTQLANWTKPGSVFLAEGDHHAFTWWGPRNYAILPTANQDTLGSGGSLVFSVKDAGITEVGTVAGSTNWDLALRSTVIRDHVWTLTGSALVGNRLDNLAQTQRISFN